MEEKVTGILLILLTLSLEFNSILLVRFIRVSAQPEEFAKKLEEYLGKAIPDDLLAEECEYVVPEGFNNTFAERLWKDLSFYVSAGCTTEELRDELKKVYGNSSLVNATLSNGAMVTLNISGVAVEREWDGSVSIKIPVASKNNLSYSHYNFTKQAGFYEAWNKTLVREYRVWRREQGWYTYVFEDLESSRSFTIVSRIWGEASVVEEAWLGGLRKLGGGAWNEPVRYLPSFEYTLWGWMRVKGPVVAVPGHYEDVRIIVPQQERSFKVLFPAYDPFWYEGWTISINFSSTSLSIGETLEISYLAEYCSPFGGEPEPLNATLTLNAPDSFQPLDSVERRLDETHIAGVFRLKAAKPGTYNITLRLDGNAVFSNTLSNMETYTVQVVSPPAPSLGIEIVSRDTSVLKHARLILRLRNNGGGAARNITMVITGSHLESVVRSVGSVEAGESRDVELSLRLLQPSSMARIRVAYSDDDGNPYLVGLETMVSTETFWVPEHFETYTVTVPEHEETHRVFVPGFESATHIRLYALWDERIIGEAIFHGEKLGRQVYDVEYLQWLLYNRTALSLGLVPIPVPGLGVELSISTGREALTEAGVKMMIKSIEPHYEYIGILKEDDALRLVNADKESLRNGNVSSDFKIEPLKPYWVKGKPIVLNSTQFALYQATMEGLKKKNPDLDYEFRETIADVRTRVGEAELGYIVLISHPLKVVGEGPLKTVRVRNFAAIGFEYTVNVETSQLTFLGNAPGEKAWKKLYLDGKEDAVLLSSSLDAREQEVKVNLTLNGRLVAKTIFRLEPESSVFWRGFWEGFRGELWRIVLTGAVMVVLTVASKGTVGAMALKLSELAFLSTMILFNAVTQYAELGQVFSRAFTLREVGNVIRDEARQFSNIGYHGTASFLNDAADEITHVVKSVEANFSSILDFLSRVGTDMSLQEWEVLLGLRKAEPYENGRVWGKVTGIAVSLAVFVAGFCNLAASGATPASLGAKAKAVLHGLYNWLTPAMTDAIHVARNVPKLAKGFGMLVSTISRMKKLGIPVIKALKMDAEGAIDLAGIFGKVLDAAGERKISDEAVQAIRELCARATELGEEEVKKLAGSIDTLLSKNTKFTDGFATWARKANPSVEWVVKTTGKLSSLDANELEGLGKALARIGDSFGLKIFDTYFLALESKQYGKGIADAFVEAVSKNLNLFNDFVRAIEEEYLIYFEKAPSTYEVPISGDQSKIQGKVVYVYVLDRNTKDIVAEGPRKVKQPAPSEEPQKNFAFPDSNIKHGDEYLILTRGFTAEDFYNKYDVKGRLVMEGGNVYYRDSNGKVLKQLGPGTLDGYRERVWVDFIYKDLTKVSKPEDAREFRLRVSSSGGLKLVYPSPEYEGCPLMGAELKSIKDDSGNVVAELLFLRVTEESRVIHLLSRNIPQAQMLCLIDAENALGFKIGQETLKINGFLEKILDPDVYSKLLMDLDNGKAAVAAFFETYEGKEAKWTGSSRMELYIPQEATKVSKYYIVWANGMEQRVDRTTFKFSDQGVLISGPEGTKLLQVDYGFKEPRGKEISLVMGFPFRDTREIGFVMDVDKDGNLKFDVKLRKIDEGELKKSWRIAGCEYQKTEYTLKIDGEDVQLKEVLVIYRDDGGKEIIGLARPIPGKIDTEHVIAVIHGEDYIEKMGGKVIGCEILELDGARRIDILAEINGRKAIVEAKTGIESPLSKGAREQPEKDMLLLLGKGKEKDYEKAYYFFSKKPSSEGAREYLKIIREVYVKYCKEYPELENRVFVIIENGSPVLPTDPFLDSYVNP